MILAHFGYESYDSQAHAPQILKAIHRQIQAQLRPRLVMDYLLDWLEQKRIEAPPYNSLQTLITDAIQAYKQGLKTYNKVCETFYPFVGQIPMYQKWFTVLSRRLSGTSIWLLDCYTKTILNHFYTLNFNFPLFQYNIYSQSPFIHSTKYWLLEFFIY